MATRKHEEDSDSIPDNWPIVRDLFAQVIEPAKDWEDSDCYGELQEMGEHFESAFPGTYFSNEDMKMALHDLNIPFERNEHNNKFYYLAKWR